MVEQKAEVVLLVERRSVIATQRRFQTIFRTRWAPVRNIILYFACSKSLKTKEVWRNGNVCALQMCGLLKMWKRSPSTSTRKAVCECGMFQCPVRRTWTCSHTKFLWFMNFLTMAKKCDFSLQHGQKEKINFFSTHGFWRRLIFMWTGLWWNRTCATGRRNLLRTPT